jgi:signal transduction histidine kinase
MNIRFRLFIGFGVLIVIFIIDFLVNQRLSGEVIRNTTYLNNSETVIRNSNQLHKIMIDMQSGFRGYLLTEQESFLQPYYDGLYSVPPLIKEQHLLVSKEQRQRLDSIDKLHHDWIEYAAVIIESKKDTLPEAGVKYKYLLESRVKMEVGKKMNDEIREEFLAFDSYEYAVRHTRREALKESISSTRNITLGLNIFSIGIAVASCIYIIRTIIRRINGMVLQAEQISRGNFKNINDDSSDELKRLSDSLNSMSSTLNKNFVELRQKNNELDQFAYVVSHDLKAPLRGISNITKWIEEDHDSELTPAIRKNVNLIKGRTKRLENMINGLLEYARVGRVRKDFEEVDVETLLKDLLELLVPASFKVTVETGMPVFVTEKIRLEQVFSNLISNAVKYHDKEDGKINISCRDAGNYYEFSVSDNGPGIQSEYHDKIFMIFQTLKERDAFESTGVGLAIVRKIIEDQKCTITIESVPERGTTFTFTWPKQSLNTNVAWN